MSDKKFCRSCEEEVVPNPEPTATYGKGDVFTYHHAQKTNCPKIQLREEDLIGEEELLAHDIE